MPAANKYEAVMKLASEVEDYWNLPESPAMPEYK